MKQFDISIIIPIYNCEMYIKDCVKSILKQDFNDLSKIQIILVDDGSTDNSLKICNELKNNIKELTIEVITGPNGGVSVARNKGMSAAKGKYILFLDSDDFISKNALRCLVSFFDKHFDEIDIATYSFYGYIQNTKKKNVYDKSKFFNRGTDVYNLDGDDFYVVQPSMNVFIKNKFEDNVKFDTTMKYHEDTKFNTMIMMKKKKIGFVEEARYYYRRYLGQVTDTKSNAYFNFDDMMNLFNFCINNYTKSDGKIEKNIQALIIHIIRCRLWGRIQNLFPFYENEKEVKDAKNKVIDVLKKIDNEIIVNDLNLDRYHKMYLLRLKDTKFEICAKNNTFTISSDGIVLDEVKNIDIVYKRFKIKNSKIKLVGFLRSPILWFKIPKLYINYKNKEKRTIKKEVKLINTNTELYKTNVRIAKFYGFEYEIELDNTKEFEFEVVIENKNMQIKTCFDPGAPFNSKIKSYKIYDGKKRVQYKNNKFYITKPRKKTRIKDYINSIKRYNKINPKINFYRILAKHRKKTIWIYNDESGIYDNAYLQFKHDVVIKDGIKRYYILEGEIDKSKFNPKEIKNVVKFGSFKHKMLFLKSDKIISSSIITQEYSPFEKMMDYYKDILKYDFIYLPSEILNTTSLKKYSKEYTAIDKIVISSSFEENNYINKYNYSKEDLLKCGMPRLDEKKDKTEPENRIIYSPSWREYLIGGMVNRKRKIEKNKFKNSDYYKKIVEYLKNERLLKVLKDNNIIIDLKLHPIFEPYSKCFKNIKNENINIVTENTNLNKYKAFITDYSPYQFDFVRLVRPICYFVPDMKELNIGLNSYRELDLKYEEAFGKLCLTSEELVDETIRIIENKFKPDDIYRKRMEKFFFKINNSKDKLYKLLKEE